MADAAVLSPACLRAPRLRGTLQVNLTPKIGTSCRAVNDPALTRP